MDRRISLTAAPALGDLRTMRRGDVVWVHKDAPTRKDWPRYADAVACAVTRGAEVWGWGYEPARDAKDGFK